MARGRLRLGLGNRNVCGQPPSPRYVARVDPLRELCGFSAALERLLAAPDEPAFEAAWEAVDLQQLGWEALAHARRANTEALEPALAEVDRRLLAVLERARAFLDPHVVTFRVAELERWQHAAAAALVGVAGAGGLDVLARPLELLAVRLRQPVQVVENHRIVAGVVVAADEHRLDGQVGVAQDTPGHADLGYRRVGVRLAGGPAELLVLPYEGARDDARGTAGGKT